MTATTPASPEGGTSLKRHPIRGFLWGALAGLGLALMLVDRAVIAIGTLLPILVIVGFAVLGVVWAFVAPPRKAR